MFHDMAVQIMCAGRKYPGALGTDSFEKEFMVEKIPQWKKEIQPLAEFA